MWFKMLKFAGFNSTLYSFNKKTGVSFTPKIEWYVWRAHWETIICTWYVLFLYSTVPSHDIFSISPSRLKNFFDIVSNVFENLLSIFCIDSAPNQRKELWKWKLWKKQFLFTCTFYLGQLLLEGFNVSDMITLKLFCHFQAFQRMFNLDCLLTDLSAGHRPLLLLAPLSFCSALLS